MNSQFDGKVALVTGGSSGIGLATAKLFAQRGATVYITGRRQKELDEAVREIGPSATGIQGDVSRLGDIDKVYQTIREQKGKLDILFANAGIGEFAPLGQIDGATFRQAVRCQRQGHALHGSGRIASDVRGQRDCPERLAGLH